MSKQKPSKGVLRKWRNHERLTAEEYKQLDAYFGMSRNRKVLRGGATGLRQQDRRRFH